MCVCVCLQAEVRVEEKDSELTKTLARLGEYEGVTFHPALCHGTFHVYPPLYPPPPSPLLPPPHPQGEYGLQEAVQEIKRRKEEIAIRDK